MSHEDKPKESKRLVRTSTIVLVVLFILTLALYMYLHGSTRFDLFNKEPEVTTVQPIPVIPWEEYQKMGESSSESETDTNSNAPDEADTPTTDTVDEPEVTERQPVGGEGSKPSRFSRHHPLLRTESSI